METEKLVYNNISPELKAKVKVLKGDETITFQLKHNSVQTVVEADGTPRKVPSYPPSQTIPATCRIYDPYKQEYVDLAYVVGQIPATRTSPARPRIGTIEIANPTMGTKILTRKDNDLAFYLQLVNWNEDCVNVPIKDDKNKKDDVGGHERPNGGYIFHQVKPAETAKEVYQQRKFIRMAETIIDEAEGRELDVMRENFKIPSIVNNIKQSDEEIKLQLLYIASKNPDAIIKSSSDVRNKLLVKMREAEDNNIIWLDELNLAWKWTDTGEVIANYSAQGQAEDALISHMQNSRSGNATIDRIDKGLEKPERQVVRRKKQMEQEAQQEA